MTHPNVFEAQFEYDDSDPPGYRSGARWSRQRPRGGQPVTSSFTCVSLKLLPDGSRNPESIP